MHPLAQIIECVDEGMSGCVNEKMGDLYSTIDILDIKFHKAKEEGRIGEEEGGRMRWG